MGGGLDKCGILWQSAVRVDQAPVGGHPLIGVDHSSCPLSQQRRAAGTPNLSDLVELADEVVVELYEHFSASHDHMIHHMKVVASSELTWDGEAKRARNLP